ncbi:hypothetical protein DRO28_00325 [Candidatus Bathyarchaeota archaeon]|nr:MAG: hypothetical protein DRO28_00325 [Candidatus Bathyarchaeota archaeon]
MAKKSLRMGRRDRHKVRVKRAAHLLFFKHHKRPGVWGWELKKAVGSDYLKVLDVLDDLLSSLDLRVNKVFETEEDGENPDKARFYITLKGTLTPSEAKMCGWRIDDLAALGVTIAYIISKEGKASRKEIESLLKNKLPEWRVEQNINRYIRLGYISEDDSGNLYLDWRTNVEVDKKSLMDLLLLAKVEDETSGGEE